MKTRRPLVYSLFSGIGGIDLGLELAGFDTVRLVEWNPEPRRVLASRFPDASIGDNVVDEQIVPEGVDVLVAGFPCKDISPLGGLTGLEGLQSSLVFEVFRLLTTSDVQTVVIENVPNMLSLKQGAVIDTILTAFEELGFNWAYRTVDTRSFGIPQKRERVVIVAMRSGDPREVLFVDDAPPVPTLPTAQWSKYATAFWPHMGGTGAGFIVNATPTLVCGTSLGVTSPLAVVAFGQAILGVAIEDGERLQGFPPGWTSPMQKIGQRWQAIGNAVSVPVAQWVGERLLSPEPYDDELTRPLRYSKTGAWPRAAFGIEGTRKGCAVGSFPIHDTPTDLDVFLQYEAKPPSKRAITGFLRRFYRNAAWNPPKAFIELLEAYIAE